MLLGVKLWTIESDRPKPVPRDQLDLEDRLEDWLGKDMALVSDDLDSMFQLARKSKHEV